MQKLKHRIYCLATGNCFLNRSSCLHQRCFVGCFLVIFLERGKEIGDKNRRSFEKENERGEGERSAGMCCGNLRTVIVDLINFQFVFYNTKEEEGGVSKNIMRYSSCFCNGMMYTQSVLMNCKGLQFFSVMLRQEQNYWRRL